MNWTILISGFQQDYTRRTGMMKLWEKLQKKASPTNVVAVQKWDDNFKELASLISLTSNGGSTVNIVAYSWGAGRGFINLSNALKDRGMFVSKVVLSDPVYRSKILPTWLPLNITSMLSSSYIKIPTNVREVWSYYQRENKPSGHRLVVKTKDTTIHPPVKVTGVTHQGMDDYLPFHKKVLAVVK